MNISLPNPCFLSLFLQDAIKTKSLELKSFVLLKRQVIEAGSD
jgi:hypothetical protein